MGEKVLEDLADHCEMPITQIQDQLGNLSRQFDQHFKSKLLVMLDVLNNLADPNAKPSLSISNLSNKSPLDKFSDEQFSMSKPVSKPVPKTIAKPKPDTKPIIPKREPLKPSNHESDKNLLEDDGDFILEDFTLNDKGKDNLVDQTSEINFLNDNIPDPSNTEIDPSLIGDVDKAFDVIQETLEDMEQNLDLSNRKLGDDFFGTMIDSIVDFSEGEPLSVVNLNLSGNDIDDQACDRICEYLIIENDRSAANVKYLDLSNNNIKDKSVDILLAL